MFETEIVILLFFPVTSQDGYNFHELKTLIHIREKYTLYTLLFIYFETFYNL